MDEMLEKFVEECSEELNEESLGVLEEFLWGFQETFQEISSKTLEQTWSFCATSLSSRVWITENFPGASRILRQNSLKEKKSSL